MAQHILIDKKFTSESEEETKAIRNIVKQVYADMRELRENDDLTALDAFEKKYLYMPNDYKEKGDTLVTLKSVEVPETMVYGGRANIEVHHRGAGIRKIYLVA